MSFTDQLAGDLGDVFLNSADYAEEITFTPAGGSPRTIMAVVEREGERQEDLQDGQQTVRRATVHVSNNALAGVGVLGRRDQFAFDSLTWAIDEIGGPQCGMYTVALRRVLAVEKSGEGFRR